MKMIRIVLFMLFATLLVVMPNLASAGLEGLVKFASPEGAMHNVTAPQVVKDQTGGYMTGGSILLRGPRPKELQPISVQTPKLKYDACTGSGDLRFGAFSYVSAKEFGAFLKNVARASGAYMLKMAIKSACPQCEDIMTYLETVARDINGLMMNQCSMAQSIAEGAFSKLTSGERQSCMMKANASGSRKDMFETTRSCQDRAGEGQGVDDKFESMLGDEFNLVWKALSKGTGADSNLKELMMSVSGTIIGIKRDGGYVFTSKPTLLQDKALLEKYIGSSSGGSKVKLYSCDNPHKCLSPSEVEVTLAPNETLYGNVSKILRSLVEKVQSDNPKLTDEEEALIGFSSIPVLQLIEMELASKAKSSDLLVRMSEFIEVLCYDVITNYLEIMLGRVTASVRALEHTQVDDTIIKNFMMDAESTRKFLTDAKFLAYKKLQTITQVKERLKQQQKEFEYGFGLIMKNMESS